MHHIASRFISSWFVATVALGGLLMASGAARAVELVNTVFIPGELTDLSGLPNGIRGNRLGGFGTDLAYDRASDLYYGITDRGPGGGDASHIPRIQKFRLNVDRTTGQAAGFTLVETMLLATTDDETFFNALLPTILNGTPTIQGLSLDPEAIVLGPAGQIYVGDEYGPALYEFARVPTSTGAQAQFVRAFNVPSNLVPRDNNGQINHVAERQTAPALVSGRQDNRGFEGLAISPDGSLLFAAVQDPLAQEGAANQGRNSRNVRIVAFDTATGEAAAQFIYQLESITAVNNRIPGTANDYNANRQGRDLGISALVALNDHELLVLERDSRGVNVDNPVNADPTQAAVGAKRVYQIDFTSATDVTNIALAGTNNLPVGVNPVTKLLVIDLHLALATQGQTIPERMEGLAIGPQLANGEYSVIISTDNDFSATGSNDVYTNGETAPHDSNPQGRLLIPTRLFAFRAELPTYTPPIQVPEPGTAGLVVAVVLALAAGRWFNGQGIGVTRDRP